MTYQANNPHPLFSPSSDMLQIQMAQAMAKCDASIEQARLAGEARRDVLVARGLARAARGRIYDAIQRGHG